MIALIDTSSLLSLVRYYLPFDKEKRLLNYIEQKIQEEEILILDEVCNESERVADGIIIKEIKYLPKYKTKTTHLLADKTFYENLDNKFCYKEGKQKLTPAQFETEKQRYLKTADAKLLLFGLNKLNQDSSEEHLIVTEETKTNNDKKVFKKIPTICDIVGIKHCNLAHLIQSFDGINFTIK